MPRRSSKKSAALWLRDLKLLQSFYVRIPDAAPTAVIRLPQGIVIELASASPQWVAALARELTRPAT